MEAKDFIEQSVDIETTLLEAFIEDDYDGQLHLMTLSMTMKKSNGDNDGEDDDTDKQSTSDNNGEEIIGLSFWREVPAEEMGDWFDFERISNMMITKSTTSIDQEEHDNEFSIQAQSRMKLVRSSSITWIKNALASSSSVMNEADATNYNNSTTLEKSIQQLTHSWVKIELIAIKQSHRAHHLGNILLGCTLAKAHTETNDHAILHVAGGGASKNVPAAKLYRRYGFVAIPRHNEGGPFTRPDRDLFVLGNIGKALEDLPLEETLQLVK